MVIYGCNVKHRDSQNRDFLEILKTSNSYLRYMINYKNWFKFFSDLNNLPIFTDDF